MTELKLHVEGLDAVFARAKAIAKRIDAGERDLAEFHFSYANLGMLLKTLTVKRWTLLEALRRHGPWSIRALAGALGRDYKAVHTDVAALIDAGFIERDEKGLISVPWTTISAEMKLAAA